MIDTRTSLLSLLRDARIAPHAFGPRPVWLWAGDATRVIFANAAGAALFGETSSAILAERHFEPDHPAAREVARLLAELPTEGTSQFAHLRGFASTAADLTLCGCSRFRLPDESVGVLVVACEPSLPVGPHAERVRRLFAGMAETAVFGLDGTLLHAGAAALPLLAGQMTWLRWMPPSWPPTRWRPEKHPARPAWGW